MKAAPFTALGIDVGGTKIAAGVVNFPSGRIIREKLIPTQPSLGGETVLKNLVSLATELAEDARRAGHSIQSIGIGLCELIDIAGRIVSQNCVAWDEDDVSRRLAHLAPVTLEADVRAAARAEALFGAGQAFRIFLYITIGTGIASCLMLDGAPYVGARGATGTMASSPLSIPCERCGHLNRRTLEQLASGPALVARYHELKPGAAQTGQDVLAALNKGDREAMNIVNSANAALASVVGLLVNVLDPGAVIVGGGLGLSEGPHWDGFLASTRQHIWSEVHRDLPILRAATGERGGFIGAAAAAWRKSQERTTSDE